MKRLGFIFILLGLAGFIPGVVPGFEQQAGGIAILGTIFAVFGAALIAIARRRASTQQS